MKIKGWVSYEGALKPALHVDLDVDMDRELKGLATLVNIDPVTDHTVRELVDALFDIWK